MSKGWVGWGGVGRVVKVESESFWTQIEGFELLHQGKWGAIGGFRPGFHLKVCLAPESRTDYR